MKWICGKIHGVIPQKSRLLPLSRRKSNLYPNNAKSLILEAPTEPPLILDSHKHRSSETHFWMRLLIFKLTVVTFFNPICRSIVTEEIRGWRRSQQWRKWQKSYYRLWNKCHFDTRRRFEGLQNEALHGDRHRRSFTKKYKEYGYGDDQHSDVHRNFIQSSIGEVLIIRDGREKLTCKACMASRFWFLVSVLPIGGKDRIQEQKRVFVSDINYEADWTEEVQKPKTKTRQKRRLKKIPTFSLFYRKNPTKPTDFKVDNSSSNHSRADSIQPYRALSSSTMIVPLWVTFCAIDKHWSDESIDPEEHQFLRIVFWHRCIYVCACHICHHHLFSLWACKSCRLKLFASTPELESSSSFHITARRAIKEIKDIAEPAIMLELANITKMKVLKGRHLREHSPSQIKGVIPSQLNVTTNGDPASDGKGRTVLLKLVW